MSLSRLKKLSMKKINILKLSKILILLTYPVIVFIALRHQFSLRLLSFFLVAMAFIVFSKTRQKICFIGVVCLACLLLCFNNALFLKLYPVLMNILVFFGFALSLKKTPLLTLFAQKMGYNLTPSVIQYTRKATIAWMIFMLCNTFISLLTVFLSDAIWCLYNGLISYILIGLMFICEYVFRKRSQNACRCN